LATSTTRPVHLRHPTAPRAAWQPPPPTPPKDDAALDFYNEEAKYDSKDFVGCIFHDWQAAMEEGREFQLPTMMIDEEIERLGILVLRVPQAPPPPPRYATYIMPPGLTEDEALERAPQNSVPHPPPPPPPPFNP
jgi:hypothetical protein